MPAPKGLWSHKIDYSLQQSCSSCFIWFAIVFIFYSKYLSPQIKLGQLLLSLIKGMLEFRTSRLSMHVVTLWRMSANVDFMWRVSFDLYVQWSDFLQAKFLVHVIKF